MSTTAYETRTKLLRQARRYAYRRYCKHLQSDRYRFEHPNRAASKALWDTEKRFPDLRTYGVESCSFQVSRQLFKGFYYLNTGDSYDNTICFWAGQFIVANWGSYAEKYSRYKYQRGE